MFGHQDENNASGQANGTKLDSAVISPNDSTDDTGSGTTNNDAITTAPEPPNEQTSNDVASDANPTTADQTSTTNTPIPGGSDTNGQEDLLEIKKAALEELTPLSKHLEQTPEEKFKTTMMMIQAADNQSLIPDAYKAAKQITDENTKAQALLDIVNEINYFTHKN